MIYYNDNDPHVCRWLRNAIDAGRLPRGHVDDRPIQQVRPSDLDGYKGTRGMPLLTTGVPCGDGKVRRIEPGIAPLAHGVPGRVVKLRGYGNAIVPQVGAAFVRAYMGAAHSA